MKRQLSALLAGAMVLVATSALAITVDINGHDYTSPNYFQQYDYIRSSSGSSDTGINKINIVDFILSGRLNDGNHTYTLLNGTTNAHPVETWFGSGATEVMITEIAGNASTNTFGYYKTSDDIKHQLFAGSASSGALASFTLSPADYFGFYLGGANNTTFYTEKSMNPDRGIHAAIFQIDNSNSYILGFEDLLLCNSDKDYQDMILKVTINNPVPEPSTMVLLGFGIFGLAVYGKRRQRG